MRRFVIGAAVTFLLLGWVGAAVAADKRGHGSGQVELRIDGQPPTDDSGTSAPPPSSPAAPPQPAAPAAPQQPRSANLTPGGPDLVIDEVSPGTDEQRPAVVTVRNAGSGRSSATDISIGCSKSGKPTTCQGGQVAAKLGALEPGGSITMTVSLNALAQRGKSLRNAMVRVCADSGDVVREGNERNNCAFGRW